MRLHHALIPLLVLLGCAQASPDSPAPRQAKADVLNISSPTKVVEEAKSWRQRDTLIGSWADEALAFAKQKSLNTQYAILMDGGQHSGLKRLHVWDFKGDSSIHSAMVSHGCCDLPWGADESRDSATFSNKDGSHCSSLGRYRIGERGYSNWGINVKYVLHGLDGTNSHAKRRLIVLHGWESVTDEETYPAGTPEGWGCPAVSNLTMTYVDSLVKSQNKDLLLWVRRD